jgi:hypothetical protein
MFVILNEHCKVASSVSSFLVDNSTSKTIKFYTPNIINMKNVDVQMYGLSAEVKTIVRL